MKKNKEIEKVLKVVDNLTDEKLIFIGSCLVCTGLNIDYTLDGEKKDEERVREEIWKILDLFTQLQRLARSEKTLLILEEMKQEIDYV